MFRKELKALHFNDSVRLWLPLVGPFLDILGSSLRDGIFRPDEADGLSPGRGGAQALA